MPLKVVATKRLCSSAVVVALLIIWALWCVCEVLVHYHPSLVHAQHDRGSLGLASSILAAAELCWLPHAVPLLRSLRAGRFAQAFRRCVESIIAIAVAMTMGVVGGFVAVVLYLAAFGALNDLMHHQAPLEWGRVDGLAGPWTALVEMLTGALTAFAAGGVTAARITTALAPRLGNYRHGRGYRCVSAGCCGVLLAGTTAADHYPFVAGTCLIAASLVALPWVRHPDEHLTTCFG